MASKIYNDDFARQAYKLCLLNATNKELADFFQVNVRTVEGWIEKKPKFADAVRSGKMMADSEVAYRMFKRATGVSVKRQKVQKDGSIVDYEEELPPDTKAAQFWLNCRTKNNANPWTPKNETELSGDADNPLAFVLGEMAEESGEASPLPNGK